MNRRKRETLILDAAIRVIARQGYAKTSVSDIIDEANVARGTFYLYFKSKKDLFRAMLDRFMIDVSRSIAKMDQSRTNNPKNIPQSFRQMASDLILTVTQNRLLTRVLLLDAYQLDTEFKNRLTLFFDQTAKVIQRNLDKRVLVNDFRQFHTDVASRCIIGSIKEILLLWLTQDGMELEPHIQGIIDYLLYGLMPHAEVSQTSQPEKSEMPSRTIGSNFH